MLEQFKKDIVAAMKAKDKETLDVLRMAKGNMQQEIIDNKKEENEELLIEVVSRQIKMRKESLVEFEKAQRDDLVSATKKEIEILSKYLPAQLSQDEILKAIDDIFAKVNPDGMKDMGKVMGIATPLFKGRADMSEVSKLIREKLLSK